VVDREKKLDDRDMYKCINLQKNTQRHDVFDRSKKNAVRTNERTKDDAINIKSREKNTSRYILMDVYVYH